MSTEPLFLKLYDYSTIAYYLLIIGNVFHKYSVDKSVFVNPQNFIFLKICKFPYGSYYVGSHMLVLV